MMVSLLGKTRESALSTELEPFSWHFLEKLLLLECVFCFNHVVLKTYWNLWCQTFLFFLRTNNSFLWKIFHTSSTKPELFATARSRIRVPFNTTEFPWQKTSIALESHRIAFLRKCCIIVGLIGYYPTIVFFFSFFFSFSLRYFAFLLLLPQFLATFFLIWCSPCWLRHPRHSITPVTLSNRHPLTPVTVITTSSRRFVTPFTLCFSTKCLLLHNIASPFTPNLLPPSPKLLLLLRQNIFSFSFPTMFPLFPLFPFHQISSPSLPNFLFFSIKFLHPLHQFFVHHFFPLALGLVKNWIRNAAQHHCEHGIIIRILIWDLCYLVCDLRYVLPSV